MTYRIIKPNLEIKGVQPFELFNHIPAQSKCSPKYKRSPDGKILQKWDVWTTPNGGQIQIHEEAQ